MPQRLSVAKLMLHCGGALLLGVTLYGLTRDPRPIVMQNLLPAVWDAAAGWHIPAQWPSFLHSYALVVATRFVYPLSNRVHYTAALCSIGLAFALELVQHPVIAKVLPSSNAPLLGTLLESVNDYALFGTFDVYDLVAVLLGAVLALWVTRPRFTS